MTATCENPADPRCKYYEPFGAAKQLMGCRDSEILIEGPAGTGKTRGVLEKINLCLLKYPGARGLIVRKSRTSMSETVLVTLESKVLPNNRELYPPVDDNLRRNRQSYNYPNSSELVVGGMDNADRIMSGEFDLIGCFEATELNEDDQEKLTTRLRNGVMPYQQIIDDCNPGPPSHWLNQRANRSIDGQKQMTRLLSRHQDNPYLFDRTIGSWTKVGGAYIKRLDALSGHRGLRLKKGIWAASEGLVYDGYDSAVHVIDEMPVGWESWRKVRAIDFGYTNPFVCQWWAIDGDGRMILYRELYMSHQLVEDHAKQINSLSAGEVYEATVADHDAEDRATLERHGVYTSPAHKSIKQGIEAVGERLKVAGDGRARISFLRGCLVDQDSAMIEAKKPIDIFSEIDGYIYPPGKDRKAPDELPVDADNHAMDTMRYAVAYADLNGAFDMVCEMPKAY